MVSHQAAISVAAAFFREAAVHPSRSRRWVADCVAVLPPRAECIDREHLSDDSSSRISAAIDRCQGPRERSAMSLRPDLVMGERSLESARVLKNYVLVTAEQSPAAFSAQRIFA